MNRTSLTILFFLCSVWLAAPTQPAQAGTYNYCLRWPVSLIDSGFGEDYGQDPTDPWRARGALVTILNPNGVAAWAGFLNSQGCTGNFFTPFFGPLYVIGWTSAKVGNNIDVEVRKSDDTIEVLSVITNPGASGTKYYVFPETPRTTMMAVASFALQRFNGGISDVTFTLNERCRPGGCCNCSSGGEIWITGDSRYRKFAIVHEIGHRILGFWTGGYTNDCSASEGFTEPCYTSSSHSMGSKEKNSCAAMEGWAHYVAADAFNDHTEGNNPNATFRYWSSGANATVNVENGPNGGVTQYMENTCNTPFSGRGVELDWLRHWWDYHTNDLPGEAGNPTTHAQMMNELDALAWGPTDAYTTMVWGVFDFSGGDQAVRWQNFGAYNGVDH